MKAHIKQEITTFIKAKLKKSDDQNIDKYRVTANITESHIIKKLNFQRIILVLFTQLYQVSSYRF